MTGTDMPRWGWGEIDRSAYTSRMSVRLTTPLTVDKLPDANLAAVLDAASEAGIPDGIAARLRSDMDRVIWKTIRAEQDAIASLWIKAALAGDQRGIEVRRTTVDDGDTIRWRVTVALSDDVPAGEIRHRSEFDTTGD